MNPFNPKCVEHIINVVTFGENLTLDEQATVETLVVEFADVFAFSLSEVFLIPNANVDLNISKNAKFNTGIRQQPLSLPQKQYMHKWIKQMLDAGMIEHADITQIKHIVPTVLTQKTHDATGGMTLEDLQAEVNCQCKIAGMAWPFTATHITVDELTNAQHEPNLELPKWRVTQNFADLNKAMQIPPLHQGDI